MSLLKRILVIEDDEDIRFILNQVLKANYEIHFEPHPSNVKSIIREFGPDLIITDNFKGEDLPADYFEQLQIEKNGNHVPVILFSGMIDIQQRVKEIKADDFIEKPASIKLIRKKVEGLLPATA